MYIAHIDSRCGGCGVGCAGLTAWGIPAYFIEGMNPYPPKVPVPAHSDWGHDLDAPIPEFAQPDPSADVHLCIIDRNTGEEWDFWQMRGIYPDYTSGHGQTCADVNVGTAVRAPGETGCRGASFPLTAGLIGPEEIQAGEIRHALIYTFDARGGDYSQFVRPASTGQCGYDPSPDLLPMGARLQLKPDIDTSGFPRGARIVAQAMKNYGMYLGDQNDAESIGIYFQTEGLPETWVRLFGDEDRSALWGLQPDHFRVLQLPSLGGGQ